MPDDLEMTESASHALDVPASPRGRKRDHSRDTDILEAALDVLAEVGAAGITMDLVAERAGAGKATIYRRWASKADLVIDAVSHLVRKQVNVESLPDTGTLRGDLLGLFRPEAVADGARRLKVMTAFAILLSGDQSLADTGSGAIVQPWADAHFALMQRAIERGEISASANIDVISQVLPSMAAYRTLVEQKPFTGEFMLGLLDGVIMPALRIHATPKRTQATGR